MVHPPGTKRPSSRGLSRLGSGLIQQPKAKAKKKAIIIGFLPFEVQLIINRKEVMIQDAHIHTLMCVHNIIYGNIYGVYVCVL